ETQLADAHDMHRQLLVERLAPALADLAQEVFLEADLGQMDPLPAGRPVDVARRNLRLGDEGHAAVAEIGEADRVPGRLGVRLLAVEDRDEVRRDRSHHRFYHEAGLGYADR